MAEYVAIPPNVQLHVHGNILEKRPCLPKTHLQARRNFYRGIKNLNRLSSQKTCMLIAPRLKILNGSPAGKIPTRCCCLNTLANVDVAATSQWVPFIDQVLLLASITLTYMAGVVPSEKYPFNTETSVPLSDAVPENSSSLGSSVRNDDEVCLQFAWDVVRGKLMDALSTIRNGVNLSENVGKLEQNPARQPSSLYAVSEGPRTRLLWRSFHWLEKEVTNISMTTAAKSANDFLAVFEETIQTCCQPLCMAWLEEEIRLISRKPDKELLSLAKSKLNGYASTIQNIRKSGKEDLYAELVYALKFGSSSPINMLYAMLCQMLPEDSISMSNLSSSKISVYLYLCIGRKGGYYNSSLFVQHGVAILEDLVITIADGITAMYLELISVDSSMSNEMNNLGLSFCTLSTRALQRLRNEVALHQWLHQNMAAVASMYEDRFDLCILQRELIEFSGNETENIGWLKKIGFRISRPISSPLHYVTVKNSSIPVKRTKELRALVGWRYYFSLFLELADITMPIVKMLVEKVSNAISFFLQCLIGRSLGLIFSGIRNSLRLK